MSSDHDNYSTLVAFFREKREMTQIQLAVKAGVGLQMIRTMEKSLEKSKLGDLRKVATALEISLVDLIEGRVRDDD